MHSEIEETYLYELFKELGDIKSCKVVRDIYSNESRRFGFVSFGTREQARNAKKSLNYKKIKDQEIRISFKRNPHDYDSEANIFLKEFPESFSTKDIEGLVCEFGEVLSCVVRTDEAGVSLRYGYV